VLFLKGKSMPYLVTISININNTKMDINKKSDTSLKSVAK
jgi:hypothetical protein